MEEVKACPCAANIPLDASIGDEASMAKEALIQLKDRSNIEVKNITTDPDTSSYRAAVSLYNDGITSTIPEHYTDTRNFSENHRKYIKNYKNIQVLMPGQTKKVREQISSK